MTNGKGSAPRPLSVPAAAFSDRWPILTYSRAPKRPLRGWQGVGNGIGGAAGRWRQGGTVVSSVRDAAIRHFAVVPGVLARPRLTVFRPPL